MEVVAAGELVEVGAGGDGAVHAVQEARGGPQALRGGAHLRPGLWYLLELVWNGEGPG